MNCPVCMVKGIPNSALDKNGHRRWRCPKDAHRWTTATVRVSSNGFDEVTVERVLEIRGNADAVRRNHELTERLIAQRDAALEVVEQARAASRGKPRLEAALAKYDRAEAIERGYLTRGRE